MFTPDALRIGGVVLDWYRFAFLLGAFALLTLAGRRGDAQIERAAWWALLLALLFGRLGYALSFWSSFQGDAGLALRAVLDLRTGGFNPWWALIAGSVTAAWLLRARARLLVAPTLAALAIGALPLLLKPAPSAAGVPNTVSVERFASTRAEPSPVPFGQIGKPTLVNVWASWCPPCRLEMPMLVDAAKRGYPIALLDSNEPPDTVRAYLNEVGFPNAFYRDAGPASRALQITGLPTSLLLDANGKVLERHFGPLDRAQLEALFARNGVRPSPGGP